jgi:hypothetical protein
MLKTAPMPSETLAMFREVIEHAMAATEMVPNWRSLVKCPECSYGADRQKCFHDLGGGCPRNDPSNYEDGLPPECFQPDSRQVLFGTSLQMLLEHTFELEQVVAALLADPRIAAIVEETS